MSGIIKKFLNSVMIEDEDFDEEFEFEEEEEESSKPFGRREKLNKQEEEQPAHDFKSRTTSKFSSRKSEAVDTVPETKKERNNYRMEKTAANKIVPIRTTAKGMEVCIMKPSSFEESQDICDMLLSGRASVVNLEGFDPMEAQRIMDFISGCVYAINGKLHQISKYIFIFSPDSIDISGDYLEFVADEGFEVPTLNKEF